MSLARRLVNRAKDLLFLPGTERYWRRRLHGKTMALVYHRVDDPAEYPFLTRGGTPVIRPEQLAREIEFLKSQGARFLTFADLRAGHYPDEDEFGIVLTFDDCFRDNYTAGLDVLDACGVKAVFFQSSGMVEAKRLIPEHAFYRYADQAETASRLLDLARESGWPGAVEADVPNLAPLAASWIWEVPAVSLEGVLTQLREQFPGREEKLAQALYPKAEDLRRAVQAGHEIGSHGHDHLHRSILGADAFERELVRSSERLSEIVGAPPAAFSYPFNGHQVGDREICARHFRQAATVDSRPIERGSDPLALGRYSWPGQARNGLRLRRWLLTGRI
jgi:peptidoglycan/xylan/chitin deacetylase (PgdA/CDA1 family)